MFKGNSMANILSNSALKLAGNCVKLCGYVYHGIMPERRFIMPAVALAQMFPGDESKQRIPRIVWQTNFTDKCTWPLWVNYRMNRHFARGYEFRYVSTEARAEYVKKHADERTSRAYSRLTDGAAQADLWRLVTLYNEGGVYLDIDACLIAPLYKFLEGGEHFWIAAHGDRVTNYLLATVPGNPVFRECIESVVERIEKHPGENGPNVFYTTGPGAIRHILARYRITTVPRKQVCLTGLFSNEHFQYMDRPNSKWGYKKTFIVPD